MLDHAVEVLSAVSSANVKHESSVQAQGMERLLAEHGEVGLANDKGEEEVDADGDGLPSSSGLDVVELRGHQPPQRAPGPGKPSSEQALKRQNGGGRFPGDVTGDLVKAAAHDTRHNHKADKHLNATLSEQHLAPKPVEPEEAYISKYLACKRSCRQETKPQSTGRQCSRLTLLSIQALHSSEDSSDMTACKHSKQTGLLKSYAMGMKGHKT